MHLRSLLLAAILACSANLNSAYADLYGHFLRGSLERSPYYDSTVSVPQNSSNRGSPLALVSRGLKFSADFDDVFSQHWDLTADFQDNYQLVLHDTSPTSQANIATGDWFVQWHFYGFDFSVGDVQPVSGAGSFGDRSIVSFDPDNIWIGFTGLDEVPAYSSYTFQIVPVPEPATLTLCTIGGLLSLFLRRTTARSASAPTPP